MTHDNAASRLHDLLVKAKTIDPNRACIHAWEQLLNAKNQPAVLLSRLGQVMALPEQIATTLSNSVNTAPTVVNHISNQFYNAFQSHKFNEKWESFINKIDDHTINYLTLASTLLETHIKTEKIDDQKISDLRKGFQELIEEVRASDTPARLKSYILLKLHHLVSLLDAYFITGANPILEAIESTVGHAFVDPTYKSFLKDEKLGQKVFECLTAAANIVTVSVGIIPVGQAVQLLLTTA